MKLIIDIPEENYQRIKEYYEKNDNVEATYSYIFYGTPLEEKTNGDVIKAMFPNIESIDVSLLKIYVMVYTTNHKCMRFDSDWWFAPYKTESVK